ncbi:MAG: RluA family pseudouridine synthase [Chlamydiales bacterium]
MMKEESDLFFITEEEAGERLDKALARRFSEIHSRTYFQYLIQEHLILVNGAPVKKRMKPNVGDEIEIQFAALPELDLVAENIPLTIIYEDDYLIAVNKPAGMVVHPAPGNWSGTFVNALLYHCRQLADQNDACMRPGIVHRLDKETSGVLLAAKTLEVQQKLIELFASRRVHKEYLAICVGKPADEEIHAPIGRHPIHRKQMAIVPSGRPAITIVKTLGWNGKLSLVRLTILTGRTHQIRVHLKFRGVPVLGDSVYGAPSANDHYHADRQLLHAAVLRLAHPITNEMLEFKADPPPDMLEFIHKISPDWPIK